MIVVESDVAAQWYEAVDWSGLAERSVRSAAANSRFGSLEGSAVVLEVSVKFAGDAEVQALNAAYRNKDKATNVLSFPMMEADLICSISRADGGEVLLGDIVLAHGVCAREAAEKGIRVEDHAAHLVVHGMLHLLGYDHETGDSEANAMEAVERRALDALGITDPYAPDPHALSEAQS